MSIPIWYDNHSFSRQPSLQPYTTSSIEQNDLESFFLFLSLLLFIFDYEHAKRFSSQLRSNV